MKSHDGTAAVTLALDPLGDTDGSRQAAVAETAQLAIDQVVRDQCGAGSVVAQHCHDAHSQLTGFRNRQSHRCRLYRVYE
jgi:hypothetical protein